MQETNFVRRKDPQRLDAKPIVLNGEDIVHPGRKLLKG
jgi:hypothetical protein